jgi:Transglutaminase-like superfamily
MHKVISVSVVLIWLVMLGALAARSGVSPVDAVDVRSAGLAGDSWMGIYLNGDKVGYGHQSVVVTASGFHVTEEIYAELTVMGAKQEMTVGTVSDLDPKLALKTFDFSLKSGPADMKINGEVSGGGINAVVESSGTKNKLSIPVNGPVHLASDIELMLRRDGLEVGKKLRVPFFDPSSLSEQHMDIEVEAKEDMKLGDRTVPVYRVRQDYAGVSIKSWINPEMGTIKSEGVMGFTFLMETREQATSRPEGGYASADIIALSSVPVEGDIPDPRGAAYIKAELTGANLYGLEISGDRQSIEGDVVTVKKEDLNGIGGVKIPVKGVGLDKYLSPSGFVQSDDPAVLAKAREIVGGEKDALRAAKKIADWVYENVDKRPTAGIPSAVEVLKNLQGDCNEHTTLYTALARAAGIPARMDAGIVMLRDRFYYHAWPEVYVGRWISIDPTFGQFPADATHIRLVEGGPAKQIAIIKLIGNLKVKILEHG